MLQIDRVELGEKGVEEPASFFTAAGDDLDIVGSDDDARKAADMPGEFLIRLSVGKELFLPILAKDTDHGCRLSRIVEMTFDPEAPRRRESTFD